MDLRKYLIPLHQPPDAPAPGVDPNAPLPPAPPVAADPPMVAADPAAPPAADPDPKAPPAVDPAQPSGEAPQHGNKGKSPWFLQRISEETAAKNAALQREADANRRARDAEALAARLQTGADPNAPPVPPSAPRQPSRDDPDFQTAVQQEAARQRLYDDSVAIKTAGVAKFGAEFGNSLNILTAVGATTDDFVSDVISVDKANAHVLMDQLAKDPERAAAIAGMNPRARIAELTRISMATAASAEPRPAADPARPAAPAPRQVSRAPAPPPPVEPNASKVTDWRTDAASDDEFDRGFKDMMQKRSARR